MEQIVKIESREREWVDGWVAARLLDVGGKSEVELKCEKSEYRNKNKFKIIRKEKFTEIFWIGVKSKLCQS